MHSHILEPHMQHRFSTSVAPVASHHGPVPSGYPSRSVSPNSVPSNSEPRTPPSASQDQAHHRLPSQAYPSYPQCQNIGRSEMYYHSSLPVSQSHTSVSSTSGSTAVSGLISSQNLSAYPNLPTQPPSHSQTPPYTSASTSSSTGGALATTPPPLSSIIGSTSSTMHQTHSAYAPTPYNPYSAPGSMVTPQSSMNSFAPPVPNPVVPSNAPPNHPSSTPFPFDVTGQLAPPNAKPRVTATLWEDEGSLCYQVEARGICVARREDNQMINGTKLLNVAGMTRGRRDGILKSEKHRQVVKIGPMHLKGVWIPFDRALEFANKEKIIDLLYPLFVRDIGNLLYHPSNQRHSSMSSSERRKPHIFHAGSVGHGSHHSIQYSLPIPASHTVPSQVPSQVPSGIPTQIASQSSSSTSSLHRAPLERSQTFPVPPATSSGMVAAGMAPSSDGFVWPSHHGSISGPTPQASSTTRSLPSTPGTPSPYTSTQHHNFNAYDERSYTTNSAVLSNGYPSSSMASQDRMYSMPTYVPKEEPQSGTLHRSSTVGSTTMSMSNSHATPLNPQDGQFAPSQNQSGSLHGNTSSLQYSPVPQLQSHHQHHQQHQNPAQQSPPQHNAYNVYSNTHVSDSSTGMMSSTLDPQQQQFTFTPPGHGPALDSTASRQSPSHRGGDMLALAAQQAAEQAVVDVYNARLQQQQHQHNTSGTRYHASLSNASDGSQLNFTSNLMKPPTSAVPTPLVTPNERPAHSGMLGSTEAYVVGPTSRVPTPVANGPAPVSSNLYMDANPIKNEDGNGVSQSNTYAGSSATASVSSATSAVAVPSTVSPSLPNSSGNLKRAREEDDDDTDEEEQKSEYDDAPEERPVVSAQISPPPKSNAVTRKEVGVKRRKTVSGAHSNTSSMAAYDTVKRSTTVVQRRR